MDKAIYRKEGGHLYELVNDEFGRSTFIHVYQNARYEKDTECNFNKLISEYEEEIPADSIYDL